MPEIQSPDPGRKLQQRYGLIGSTPAPFLSPELVPVVMVDDLSDREPGIFYATVGDFFSNIVGERALTRLSNPAGSGVTLEEIRLSFNTDVTGQWNVGVAGPVFAVLATPLWQDSTRVGVPAGIVAVDGNAAAPTGEVARGLAISNEQNVIDFPNYIIREGDALIFGTNNTNVDLTLWWTWGERPVER